MRSLVRKTIVITGAGSGIGRSLALQAAKMGAQLALCDVDSVGLAVTKATAERAGARVVAMRVDVADGASMKAFAAQIAQQLGGADVLINNAGVSLSETIERMKQEDFEWLFNINFWGTVHGCTAFMPQLRTRPEAHIVNISSVFGLIGIPGQAAYCASKFAVRGFAESLRSELSDSNIGVTAVFPGGVRTNIVRNGRHYSDGVGGAVDGALLAAQFERLVRVTPERAAASILAAVISGKRRLLIGGEAHLFDLMQRVLPGSAGALVNFFTRRLITRFTSRVRPAASDRRGSSPASEKPPLAS